MKNIFIFFLALTFVNTLTGCDDSGGSSASGGAGSPGTTTQYLVSAGNFVFEPANYLSTPSTPFKFSATFNANTNYTAYNIAPQVNKLYGFVDCGATNVLTYSARFGWEVVSNQLMIFAILQTNGVESYGAAMATIQFSQAYTYEIDTGTDTNGPHYIFTIKDAAGNLVATKTDARPCSSGAQYLNTPYFGGTTPAPRDMEIDITDL